MRGKRGRGTLVAAAVALMALTGAGSPAMAAGKPAKHRHARTVGLFGTNGYQTPTLEEYRRMSAGGLSSIRLVFYPGFVEPNPGPPNWRDYDNLVATAARGGISIDPTLFGVPRWISADPATLPLDSPAAQGMWFDFVRAAARRYGPGGDFWAAHPELRARPMRSWEVWNEPNINEFAGQDRPVKAKRYGRLLRLTRSALNAGGRGNRIVVGGLYRRPKPGYGIRMTRFLQRLYRLRRGRRLFDAVAIHPYAARPKQILRVSRSARRVMDANRDRRKPIWITEVGWTTGGNYWAQSLYRATLRQQAARVGHTARLLLRHRRELHLKRVDWMTWRDRSGGDGFWADYMGLFTADGHPKPAWGAFTRVTGGYAGGQIEDLGEKPAPGPPTPPPGGGGSTGPGPLPICLLPGVLC